jgi:tetratricopeptide (TPR) repeat protein
MTSTPLDRNLDAQVDSELEYKALIRSLKYTQGFGLLFVQCSPAEGQRLIARVRKDLLQKHIEVLSLTEPIETLYDKVETLYRNKPIDVLFVQGIEHSLYDYEKNRLWSDEAQRRSYSETGIPRLLQHLNLSRERFYEDFAFHFVFLVSHFVLKYLTRRAPDFFDWRSGVLEFAMDRGQLHQESTRATVEQWQRDNQWDLPPDECRKNLLEIQALIEEPYQTDECKADLFFEQGRLFGILEEYEEAIASYNKALQFKPDDDIAWSNRGIALSRLGHHEEAIASFDKALQFKPDHDSAWYNRGNALGNLGRYEGAIASYDKALQFKPDYVDAWYNQGIALGNLGRYEEAIASYDKVLQFKPDYVDAWNNRGVALDELVCYEEAIASYDKALQLNPDKDLVLNNRGNVLSNLGRYKEAIASYDKALQLNPYYDLAWYNRGIALDELGRYEEAIASYDKALQLNPYYDLAWYNRGIALVTLGNNEEAIASYDKALTLNPNDPRIFYNKACSYALQANPEDAIANLSRAIELSPEQYQDIAKTDSDFDLLRDNERFNSNSHYGISTRVRGEI